MAHFETSYQTIDSPYDENTYANETVGIDTIFKLLILLALLYFVWSDSWSIQIVRQDKQTQNTQIESQTRAERTAVKASAPLIGVELPASAKSTTAFFIDPYFAQRHQISAEEKQKAEHDCRVYVKKYAPVAVGEMKKYGIPASITLAQGLLESNAGQSRLATSTNNHFGIKCFSNKCKKGHCKNFTDDTHKDFFRTYDSVWGSFRAHSQFLKNGSRYQQLFKLSADDHRAWAVGLKKAGYATDPKYAHKLVALIQNLGLDKYDK